MAVITAVKSGNWSDPTVWSSNPVMPGVGDTVRPGAFVVVIDQDTNVVALEGSAGQAGYFRVNAAGLTIDADITVGGSTAGSEGFVRSYVAAGGLLTIIGNLIGATATLNGRAVRLHGAGGVTITGNIIGGGAGAAGGLYVLVAGDQILVTGNITGGSSSSAYGAFFYARTVRIEGDVTGNLAEGVYLNAGYLTVVGNVLASVTKTGILVAAKSAINVQVRVTGNVTAVDNAAPFAALNGQSGIVFVYGGVAVVSGQLIDSLGGLVAVAGTVFRDIAYPQSYIDLPYIDLATEALSKLRYRVGSVSVVAATFGTDYIAAITD